MPKQLFANNAISAISGSLAQGGTTLVCEAGQGSKFPTPTGGDFFLLTIYTKDAYAVEQEVEVVKVTARAGDVMTIERDVELLTGQVGGLAYNSNVNLAFLELRWTAAGANGVLQAGDNLAGLTDAAAARTNIGLGSLASTYEAKNANIQAHIGSSSNPHGVTKSQVGLGNVDNTSDMDKPISTATALAIAGILTSGVGGEAASGNIVLTASSPAMQHVAPTGWGQSVTLPDATTCTKGIPLFSINNAGKYPLMVKDSTGTLLGFLQTSRYALISLSDKSTAAGVWDILGSDLAGTDVNDVVSFASAIGSGTQTLTYVGLDTSRDLLIISGNTSCHAVVYDHAARQFGTPVLLRTAVVSAYVSAIKTATDQVMVVSSDVATGFEAVVLTFSGTTITVNTAATATLAGTISGMGEIVAVGTSWVVSYNRATNAPSIRALTISGTTVTIGSEATVTGTGIVPIMYPITSSVVLVLSQVANGPVTAHPYTVSGATLTPGTSANSGAVIATTGFLCRTLSGGRFAIVGLNASGCNGVIFSVSGTTATASTVSLGATVSTTLYAMHQIGDQCIVASGISASALSINVLTDNVGTAVAGTELLLDTPVYAGVLGFNASELWLCTATPNTVSKFMAIGISGNNPSLISVEGFYSTNTGNGMNVPNQLGSYKNVLAADTLLGASYGGAFGKSLTSPQVAIFNGRAVAGVASISAFVGTASGVRQSNSILWSSGGIYNNGQKTIIRRLRMA